MNDIKLNYDDVTIVPEIVSTIGSRSECDPYDDTMLPIFASCMSTVVSKDNVKDFNNAKIRTVIPRTYPLEERLKLLNIQYFNFVAFSLKEIQDFFLGEENIFNHYPFSGTNNICIDLANGHMKSLLDTVKAIKTKYGNRFTIMTGNIANPETYRLYEEAGVDFVRLSIGSGAACITSSCVGVHYPVFSLLKETYEIKKQIGGKCKIIADGGIREFRDIQKALIYADYVMVGSVFNKAMESAGKTTYGKRYWNIRGYKILRPLTTLFTYGKEIPRKKYDWAFKKYKEGKLVIWKKFYGMASKEAQKAINDANSKKSNKLKTSEGLVKYQKVEYNLAGWAENETDYLRSAMSYTDSHNLSEYKESQWTQITQIKYNK